MTPLAIDGGTPVRTEPIPGWPRPTPAEIAAVTRVLESGRINYHTGSEGKLFEAEYAKRLGRSHGIALANGTLALELALLAFGVGVGDEVIVPARTFIATASACVALGATPVVADIDPDSGCITPATVLEVITPRTRAVIPVHLAGWPTDMPGIMSLAEEYDLLVIEDCAQAHGARIAGREVGSFGHAAAYSFCQDKILTTGGEGGLLLLDDDAVFERAWAYKDHGKSYARSLEPAATTGSVYRWMHDSFGTNWRMTEMQAAIGRVALTELDEWVEARRRNAQRLRNALADCAGLAIPEPPGDVFHSYYRLMGHVDAASLAEGWDRDRIIRAVQAEGVPCMMGSCAEIYREVAFIEAGLAPSAPLPGAHLTGETSIGFLVHPTLADSDIDDVGAAVRKVLEAAQRR